MVTCSHEVMQDTRDAYARLYDTDLVGGIGGGRRRLQEHPLRLAKTHPANIILGEYDYEPDVSALRDAVEGLGTDEAALIDVLANKTPEQIAELKDRYQAAHGEMLKERIKAETTGLFESAGFRNTLMGLLTPREEQIAFYLEEAFEGWFSNDDWGLISMLVHRTPEEMKEIRNQYMICHGADLIQDIRAKCSGDYEKALVALVAPRARTIARGIKAAMSGWISSANKGALISLLTHRDAEMKTLRVEFEKEANMSLQSMIKKECSGQFEKALVALAAYTAPKGIASRLASGEEAHPDAARAGPSRSRSRSQAGPEPGRPKPKKKKRSKKKGGYPGEGGGGSGKKRSGSSSDWSSDSGSDSDW